ncbi:MAG: aspartate aminotransferase family protein [Bacteriovoracales bacterium]|nr:aspartate aminotransferase family protein [Bacteriovoracales bacterium]
MKKREQILRQRERHLYPTKIPYYREPLHLIKALDFYVWDEEGVRYLDAIGGIVSISAGHNHPRIKEKILKMLASDAIQHTSFLYLSEYMADLAEKLSALAPGTLTKCYFTNSGSEANEMAVMTARMATGHEMVVSLRHAYHGGTGVPLGLCGHSTWKYPHQPQANVIHAQAPYCYRCPYGASPQTCELECAEDVRQVIETAGPGRIGAFIKEPIMGVGGFIDAGPDYHQKVFHIVKEYGGLYISDEVQTGAGRTGKHFFMSETLGIEPDIITMAKGIGNGAPLGAVVAKSEWAQTLAGKSHFNTFGGDPYQAMQARETIAIIEDEDLIANADHLGEYLLGGLKELQGDFPLIGDIRGRGLLIGLELVQDPKAKTPAPKETSELMERAKDEGVLIGKGGLYGNVIRLAPPLSITREGCDELLTGLRNALMTLKGQSF